jgi:hypothetical protein
MPHYYIHRMKEHAREHFRWAAHTGGLAIVKPKEYEPGGTVEGANPYEIWKRMSASEAPLQPGDLLEGFTPDEPEVARPMWIAKYIGFEPAQWFVPEVRASPPEQAPADGVEASPA